MSPILGIWASSRPVVEPDTGAMFPLQVITLSAATSTVTFTNIPSTYSHLQFRCNLIGTSQGNIGMRFNNDSTSNYRAHMLQGDGATAVGNASGQETAMSRLGLVSVSSTAPAVSVMDILDYANTNKNKVIRVLTGQDNNGSGTATDWRITLGSGLWMSTSAINRIDFVTGATYGAGSQFALYGIKGA